ncbi:uncharacterized protein LOC128234351 isoform X1 [Mya arenaria]|uniref:uncharacterized protein LOC128234351 isoform X1 n=1 Tax=Mya arenaria TaxID=6604 RepID=UPI0022E6BB8B|nr:uncharacterized protein LOC128234351 isoform X1 [Mya arenaria]
MDTIFFIFKFVFILLFLPSHQCAEPKVVSVIPQFPDNVTIPDSDCERCLVGTVGVYINVECVVLGISKKDLILALKLKRNGQDVPNVNVDDYPFYRALYSYMPSEDDTDHTVTCEATQDGQQPKIVSITLLVLRKPSIPTIMLPESIKEGKHAPIICKTFNARPEPRLYFMYNSTTYNTSNSFSKMKGDKTVDVKTILDITFSRYDNSGSLTCCVEFREYDKNTPKIKTNYSTSAFDVLFPPKFIQLEELNRTNDEEGNTSLRLQCTSDVSNPVSKIRWNIESNFQYESSQEKEKDEQLSGFVRTMMLSANLTRHNNGEQLSCYIENPEFPEIKVIKTYKINITYKPFIGFSPSSPVTTYVDDSISVVCQCDANPAAEIVWSNTSSNKIGKRNEDSLELNLQYHSTGRHNFTCNAKNTIGSAVNEVFILVKEKPFKTTIPMPRPTSSSTGKNNSSSMLIGIICGCLAVLIIVLVAVGCVVLSRRRKKTPTREGSYSVHIQERQPSFQPLGPVYDNLAGSNNGDAPSEAIAEPVEYACVVKKEERQTTKPQAEDGALIYADLDLPAEGSTRGKPAVNLDVGTTYVSIDIAQTAKMKGSVLND